MRYGSSKNAGFAAFSTLVAVALLAMAAPSVAQPASLAVQGRLMTKSGPAPDGDYGITLLFYEKKDDTKALFTHVDAGVKVIDGAFVIGMGDTSKLDTKPWSNGKVHWMGVKVGSEPELPRVPIRSVPYAIHAGVASSVKCTGCVGSAQIDPALLKGLNDQFTKISTSVAGNNKLASDNAKALKGLHKVAQTGKFFDLEGIPPVAEANQKCKAGEVVTGVDAKGNIICAKDAGGHDLKTLDARFVNEKQANSITGAMVTNGTLAYVDTDTKSIQRRVASSCPAGQAIRVINENGTVTCADAGQEGPVSGKVVNGNWYRIAQSVNGTASGTLTIADLTFGAVIKVAVAISGGDGARSTVRLLQHNRNSFRLFSQLRVLEKGVGDKMYIYVKADQNGNVALNIDGSDGAGRWAPVSWTQTGTSTPNVSGYTGHNFNLDRLQIIAQDNRKVTVNRTGALQWLHSDDGDTGSDIYSGGPGGVEINTRVVPGKGLEAKTYPLNVYARNKANNSASTVLQVRHDGLVGIGAGVRAGYTANIGGHVHMNDRNVNYVNQLHFNHGPHFFEQNDGRYINFKWNSSSHGGLIFRDSSNNVQGYLYGDGHDSNPSFGFLDKQGQWSVQVRHDDYILMRVNNATVMTVDNAGVGIMSGARSGYALDIGGHVDMSDKNLNYANQVHFNHGNHFYEANDGRYINYKWANGSYGGIRFYDGNGTQQGFVYGDGDGSKPSFGLLDSDGNWAVHVRRDDYTRLLVNNSEKLRADADGVNVSGSLRTADGRWQRDIWNYSTTYNGGRYLHIKTNIKFNATMFCFQLRGYNYGRSREIYNVWCGYANSDNKMHGLRHRQYDDGLYNMHQYRTNDDYLAVRVYANNVYYMGLSASAWTLNPAGKGHQTKVLTYYLGSASSNRW